MADQNLKIEIANATQRIETRQSDIDSNEEMNKKYTETKRDLDYIYFDLETSSNPESKLRIPLKSGIGGMYMFLRNKWQWVNNVDFKRED